MAQAASRYTGKVFGGNYGDDVDISRWVVIYPPYLDRTRKVSEGRKIGKEKCVDKPNTQEVFEAAKLIGLRTVAEPEKAYCRDYWVRGRVKVCLFDADGSALNADIPNSEFMAHAGARIHALSDMRTARKGRTLYAKVAAQIPKCREKGKSAQNKGSSAGNKAGGSKKKKKGKR